MFFDTHVHIGMMEEAGGAAAVIARARDANVTGIMAIGGREEMNAAAIAAARKEPDLVRAAVGLDRDQADRRSEIGGQRAEGRIVPPNPASQISDLKSRISVLRNEIKTSRDIVAAIGEIGLDFHYHPETGDSQKELFRRQLALARELELPVIVHSREAEDATIELLREHAAEWKDNSKRIGVLHCFTGTNDFAQALNELGYYISFSGIITFRNAEDLRQVASLIPTARLLIETDSPYLAPVPHRGKINEPSLVSCVAKKLAEIRGVSVEEIARITTANAEHLFAL